MQPALQQGISGSHSSVKWEHWFCLIPIQEIHTEYKGTQSYFRKLLLGKKNGNLHIAVQWGWITHHGLCLDKHCLENCWICSEEKGSIWKSPEKQADSFWATSCLQSWLLALPCAYQLCDIPSHCPRSSASPTMSQLPLSKAYAAVRHTVLLGLQITEARIHSLWSRWDHGHSLYQWGWESGIGGQSHPEWGQKGTVHEYQVKQDIHLMLYHHDKRGLASLFTLSSGRTESEAFSDQIIVLNYYVKCSCPRSSAEAKAAEVTQQNRLEVMTKSQKGWFGHSRNHQVLRCCSLVPTNESLYICIQGGSDETRTNGGLKSWTFPAVPCWRACTKCSPAEALTEGRCCLGHHAKYCF